MVIFFGIASFAPIMAFAEETPKNSENSVDIIADGETLDNDENASNSQDIKVESNDNKDILPKTEDSKWFEEKIEPLLWEYGTEVVALGTICLIVFKKGKKAAKAVSAAASLLTESNNDNKTTQADVKKLQQSNEEWKREMEAQFDKRFEQIKTEIVDTEKDTNHTVHKLLQVEEIAYEGNPTLVSKGAAKKISEVIHNDETKG